MRKIAIANQKGGCGKTTTTINLSGALVSLGRRVLVIDMDPQAHASFGLGVSNQPIDQSTYNIFTDNPEKRRPLDACIVPSSQNNLDIVPSNILLSTLEQELKDKEDAVSKLHNTLSGATLDYDYIIIDCPPSLGFLTFNALRAAELVIVPIDMSAFSLMGVGKLLGMLELIKLNIGHAPRVNALATLVDKRTKYSATMLNDIKNFFKDQMLETVIRASVSLKKAVSQGVPVVQFDNKSNGAVDYMLLTKELVKMEGEKEFEKALEQVSPVSVEAAPVLPPAALDVVRIETQTTEPTTKEILFTMNVPNAKDIYIVGDFNHWKIADESRLSRVDGERWEKRMNLLPGSYRYKFVVDGEWILDTRNSEKEPNPFGTFDSVMRLQE